MILFSTSQFFSLLVNIQIPTLRTHHSPYITFGLWNLLWVGCLGLGLVFIVLGANSAIAHAPPLGYSARLLTES